MILKYGFGSEELLGLSRNHPQETHNLDSTGKRRQIIEINIYNLWGAPLPFNPSPTPRYADVVARDVVFSWTL